MFALRIGQNITTYGKLFTRLGLYGGRRNRLRPMNQTASASTSQARAPAVRADPPAESSGATQAEWAP